MISYGRHLIDESDIEAVTAAIKSSNLTQGPRVQEFEESLGRVTGARFAVAVNSGTSALHLACRAAGIGAGDEVITSPNTFVASANCVVYCGARPVFADIDPRTYNIAPQEIAHKINAHTKAVIPVHFAGQSCDMEAISQLVKDAERRYGHRIFIIEDAAHALGSKYKGVPVGSCALSDMAIMSFHPVKHITTGEGGVALTNDAVLARSVQRLRSHGITSTPQELLFHDQAFTRQGDTEMMNPWYYEQQDLGYNYRITDLQCALGISQLAKLETFRVRRRAIADRYHAAFRGLPHVQIPFESPECGNNLHLYVLLVDFDTLGVRRAEFMRVLRARGIGTQVHYIPVHTQPFYQRQFGTRWGDYPNVEAYYERCLSFPLYPAMSDDDIEYVIDRVTETIKKA